MKNTILSEQPRPLRIRRESVIVLLVLAFAIGGVGYFWIRPADPAREHVQAGLNYLRINMAPEAERELKEAVRANPDNAEAWELLAKYYLSDEDYSAAVEPLRELARLRPDTPHIFDRLASCAAKAGDPALTLRRAEEALRRNPNDVGALAVAVKILSKRDDERKRLTYLRQMVKLRPKDMDFLVLLARTLTNAHLYDEAAPLIERMLQLDPNSVDAYGLRGRRRLDTGTSPQDLALSEADFQKALSLNPHGPMILLQLGKLYVRMGQTERAITHLEDAAHTLPDQPEILFVLADAYTQGGKPDQAAAARKRFAALRQREDQITSLEKRCAANPNDSEVHLKVALLALEKGDLDKAQYYLNQAQTLRPGDPRCTEALKQLAARRGEAGSAGAGEAQ